MKKFFFFAAGVFFTSYGLTFIIIYLNLLNMGYTLFGYIKYILTHFECLIIILGIILLYLSFERKDKNIKVTKSFLDNLLTTDYTCIFTTEIDSICVKFDKDGYIKLLSKLLLLEERDILDDLTASNQIVLKYKKLSNKQTNNSEYTRYEKQNIDKILNFLNKESDNTSLIN